MKDSINIKIAGKAGEGIKSVGLILSKTLMKAGFWTFDYIEYPSLIRGGHNTYQVHAAGKPVYSQVKNLDLLIALDEESLRCHQPELTNTSLVIYDSEKIKLEFLGKLTGVYLAIPLQQLTKESGGLPVMANNTALGAVIFLLGIELQILKEVIAQIFADKEPRVIQENQKVVEAGFAFAQEKFSDKKIALVQPQIKEAKILISGNEAVALGAISAGMKFYAAYPMTPTTSILHYLASKAKAYQLLVKHAEDEISVINMAVGAAFAGVRSMVATSGGGFCLMTETLGMSGMMELPIVVVEGMRSGPSTGMPTWSDQADLKFVINASHGEFPRLVLSPGDIEECFYLTRQAFYFSEKYQLPVIILIDKYLAESLTTIKAPAGVWQNSRYSFANQPIGKNFKRYLNSENGISFRSLPGWPDGEHLANSYEHDESGFATETIEMRKLMVEKRLRKFETLRQETEDLKPFQTGNGKKIGLISWGSNKGPILEALANLKEKASEINFLNLNLLWPFPKKALAEFTKDKEILLVLEVNATGQLVSLIREQLGLEIKHNFLKYDGRPFWPEEVLSYLNNLSHL